MSVELLPETPSQTGGPYVHIGLALKAAGLPERGQEIHNTLARSDAPGQHITLIGSVFDGNGHLVRDAFLEFWQADSEGNYQQVYDHESLFNSFGRASTTFDDGEWELHTVKPGSVSPGNGKTMAPHINVSLFARGINIHLQTRIYFEDEPELNEADPVMNRVEPKERRKTLVARPIGERDGRQLYRFDIRVQGAEETVFLDF